MTPLTFGSGSATALQRAAGIEHLDPAAALAELRADDRHTPEARVWHVWCRARGIHEEDAFRLESSFNRRPDEVARLAFPGEPLVLVEDPTGKVHRVRSGGRHGR